MANSIMPAYAMESGVVIENSSDEYVTENNIEDDSLENESNEEIVQEDGKFYLCHTMYPSVSKEISKATAAEMWQTYNMKERGDISFLF